MESIQSGNNSSFAIDLLWIRVGKNGGTESFIRTVLDGMCDTQRDFKAVLLVSRDNKESFAHYGNDKRYIVYECPVDSANVKARMIWQNLHLRDTIKSLGIDKCLEPVYSMPFIRTRGVDFYTVIHDLQAKHFPEYFSKLRCLWMDISWRNTVRKARKVIAISDYVKNDIASTYKVKDNRIVMIHNPIATNTVTKERAIEIIKEYDLEDEKFFFCVSSLLPHKNLQVLIRMMALRNDDTRLAIVGVGGALEEPFRKQISNMGLDKKISILPFVSNETRDALYKTCKAFLFPSTFEGFGMPPIEAMLVDKPVVTTRCTSIPEVTRGEAVYVDNPKDEKEWNERVDGLSKNIDVKRTISSTNNPYEKKKIAEKYLDILM